ncbi:MAG: nucleotide exchange factor GrpE [Thermonemataceae bacterium]|nr:nucleotide exchange factor GrpE [Thermonemataceae bacterium]
MENLNNQDDKKENLQPEELQQSEETTLENMESTENEQETTVNQGKNSSLDNKVKVLEENLAEQKNNYLRLYADFENFRRRTAKEKIEFLEQANAKLLVELLPVFDDFERALKSFENQDLKVEVAKEGVQLIYQKFAKFLEKQGLKVIETNQQDFDPDKHEAITQVPAPTEELRGKVIDTIEKGYYLGEKVVRFAKVVIGS